ncbi:MAG TPA: hypothetical protein VJS47_04935 [Rhizomicrobium sp.]|nr:hypothetical protein [Rhizomicrobium sp.]
MLRTLALAATLGLIGAPAFAQSSCHQPYVPEALSSANPTKQEIIAMRDDAKSFIEASDVYQTCLGKAAMSGSVLASKTSTLIAQNQRDKKLVGDRVNAAIAAFNASQRAGVKVSDASQ